MTEQTTKRRRTRGAKAQETTPPKSPTEIAVEQYMRGVMDGSIPAGELLRLAVERQLRDLDEGPKRGLRFVQERAERVIEFISYLKHSKGEWAGQPFVLRPCQLFEMWVLFGWERADGTRRFRTAYDEEGRKNGKALAVDTPVATPTGWMRHGDLRVGDFVFGPDGHPKKVTYITKPYLGPCHRLLFNDGRSIVAHNNHEWQTRRTAHTGRTKGSRGALPLVETQQIANTLRHACRGDYTHGISVARPLQTPPADLPIPPYTLGAWLGDGHSADARLTCSDLCILDRIREEGVSVKHHGKILYSLGRRKREQSPADALTSMRTKLIRLGVLNNKHIPMSYLRSSEAQRRKLLCGLMDTDGHVTQRGQCEIVLTCKALFDGVVELLVTLGYKPTQTEDVAKLHGKTISPRYRVQFWARPEDGVVSVPRKATRLKSLGKTLPRSTTRMIVGAERIDKRMVNCIEVEGGFYLAGPSMIATHNSTKSAAIGLYMTFADGEPGAECYSAATKKEQAMIVHGEATRMVRSTPELSAKIQIFKNNLCRVETGQKYEPLGADEDTLDGLNVHCGVIDELHAHRTRGVYDVIATGSGARRQPLMYSITTAGTDQTDASICWELHCYAEQVLRGIIQDDQFFAVIYAMDEGDDWQDERNWYKSNPNLGVSKKLDYMREGAKKAAKMPGFLNTFLRLELNKWCMAYGTLITMADGSVKAIEDIHDGELVLAFDAKRNVLVPSSVISVCGTGTRPVFRITTARGREIIVTGNHSFWCRAGRSDAPEYVWIEAAMLCAGDRIAVALGLTTPLGGRRMNKEDAQFLGIMTGDGSCHDPIKITNLDHGVIDWCRSYAASNQCALVTLPDGIHHHFIHADRSKKSLKIKPLKRILKTYGLFDKTCRTKRIPSEVFKGGPKVWASFIAGYLDTDGHIAKNSIIWVSCNFELLQDCQFLLAHLGVQATLTRRSPARHRLEVMDAASIDILARTLPLCHSRKRVAIQSIYGLARLHGPLSADRREFDRVKSVELLSPMPTIGMEVADVHTHVTNGLISHNTQQTTRWIDMGLWDANAGPRIDESAMLGRSCYGGLDLSSVSDLTAWLLLFPDPVITDRVTVLARLWCPEAKLQDEHNRYRDQYQAWARDGWLLTTPGNAIDYDQIEQQIVDDAASFQIQEIAVDRLFQGYQLSMRLQEHHGLTVAACGMGYMSMAGPCAEFERRLLDKKIHHGGHPVLKWMANNVAVREDPAGNKKPDKSTSQGKIDGIVGLLLALDRVMRHTNTTSVYEDRGILTLGGE